MPKPCIQYAREMIDSGCQIYTLLKNGEIYRGFRHKGQNWAHIEKDGKFIGNIYTDGRCLMGEGALTVVHFKRQGFKVISITSPGADR